MPNEIHEILLQKIDDVDTLINYFSSYKITREISLLSLVHDIRMLFTNELPRRRRTFKTYLEYLRCYRFTINIEKFKSFHIYGLVTDMPLNQLKRMNFEFLCSSCDGTLYASTMKIIDCDTYREIVFDDPKYECQCVDLGLYGEGMRRTHIVYNSEKLLGRNTIYEKNR